MEKKIEGIIDGADDSTVAASEIVQTFRELQDAGGLKVCQNVTLTDLAYREVQRYGTITKTYYSWLWRNGQASS